MVRLGPLASKGFLPGNKFLVEPDRLLRNRAPTENFLRSPPARFAEAPAFLGVLKELRQPLSQVPRKLLRIRGKTGYRIVCEGHQKAGFSINDNLFDTPGRAGHDGCAAGHRLQIDNPERLVNARAAENAGMAVKLHRLLFA